MAETIGSDGGKSGDALPADSTVASWPAFPELDVSLLEYSLSLTPRERMQANDDALNFAESLRAAMLKRNRPHHRAASEGN